LIAVLSGWLRRPEISRFALASYRRELRAEAALPACYALLEGGFVGVLADKVFQLGPFGSARRSCSGIWRARVGRGSASACTRCR
jgi:hypothetical protein